ncbi:MAG: putative transposase [Candidatus Azotimanducaceae bacterium]|jgi:putative transposase
MMALKCREPIEDAIFHTNQGIEYAANIFHASLVEPKLKTRTSGKGRCLNNANAESFFHTVKTECFYQLKFSDMKDVRQEFLSFIRFYNEERLHSTVSYKSPNDFEQLEA